MKENRAIIDDHMRGLNMVYFYDGVIKHLQLLSTPEYDAARVAIAIKDWLKFIAYRTGSAMFFSRGQSHKT